MLRIPEEPPDPKFLDEMWSNLPFDLLAKIFSYLSPDSFARAKAVCRSWHDAAKGASELSSCHRHPPWFLALPTRSRGLSWIAHNPISNNWHVLSLDHISCPVRPIATIGGLVLLRVTSSTSLKLAICNPFTRQFKHLDMPNVTRTNPAIGVVEHDLSHKISNFGFKIYVAGGISELASSGAVYQPTLEMYQSSDDTWKWVGLMPVEFAVRLTVWTPNESVFSNGILYWMTSARAYCVMGFELETNKWRELSVPMADKLAFATLVARNRNLTLIGGTDVGNICIWEIGNDGVWSLVEKVPFELGVRLLGSERQCASVKCVGIDGAICLYRDIDVGFIVWREDFGEGKWEWNWIEGCSLIGGRKIQNSPIKGLLLQPNFAHSTFLSR